MKFSSNGRCAFFFRLCSIKRCLNLQPGGRPSSTRSTDDDDETSSPNPYHLPSRLPHYYFEHEWMELLDAWKRLVLEIREHLHLFFSSSLSICFYSVFPTLRTTIDYSSLFFYFSLVPSSKYTTGQPCWQTFSIFLGLSRPNFPFSSPNRSSILLHAYEPRR